MKITYKVMMAMVTAGMLNAEPTWYDQKLEGWYYFEDRKNEELQPATRSLDDAEDHLELEKKTLKKTLSLALLNPSEENVENYMRQQKKWLDQSARFAAMWGKVLLEKPFLGDFLTNPTTSYGIIENKDLALKKRKSLLHELSKTHFLLFFFNGKEPFSEKAGEVATLFASVNNWKVKAVSLDGHGIKAIPDYVIDKGISHNLGIQSTPSFYIIDSNENKIIPVGAGLLSVSDLEQNIEVQLGERNDE